MNKFEILSAAECNWLWPPLATMNTVDYARALTCNCIIQDNQLFSLASTVQSTQVFSSICRIVRRSFFENFRSANQIYRRCFLEVGKCSTPDPPVDITTDSKESSLRIMC